MTIGIIGEDEREYLRSYLFLSLSLTFELNRYQHTGLVWPLTTVSCTYMHLGWWCIKASYVGSLGEALELKYPCMYVRTPFFF